MNANDTISPMTPCPKTPNCVSSVDTGRGHYIQPLRFEGSAKDAQYKLLRLLNKFDRAKVITFEENIIHVEFTSPVLGFVDDAEFHFDENKKIVHVRSASRIGFSDLGVNRRRIEQIRKRFELKDQRRSS